MDKYIPEGLRIARDAYLSNKRLIESVHFQTQVALRFANQMSASVNMTLEPLSRQIKQSTSQVDFIRSNFSRIQSQIELYESLTDQVNYVIKQMDDSAIQVVNEMFLINDVLKDINMRNIIYDASTITINESLTNDEVETIESYRKVVISYSPLTAHETLGVMVWTYTACQIFNNPSLIEVLFIILSYVYNEKLLLPKDDKNEG